MNRNLAIVPAHNEAGASGATINRDPRVGTRLRRPCHRPQV